MSIDEKTDVEDKTSPDGLQAVSGPADGSAPKYRDEENSLGAAHEVRINGVGESPPEPHIMTFEHHLTRQPYPVRPMFSEHSRSDICR